MTQLFSHRQLERITYIWIVALVASCMLVPLFGISRNIFTVSLLLIAGFWLLWRTRGLFLKYDENRNIRFAFMNVNFYVLIVVLLLSIDKFFNL